MKKWELIKKVAKYLTVFLLLLLILLASFIDTQQMTQDFSSYNSDNRGVKALFLLTKKMGFDVARFEKSARFLPESGILVIIKPVIDQFESEKEQDYLLDFVKKGNVLVCAEDDPSILGLLVLRSGTIIEGVTKGTKCYSLGKGTLIVYESPEELTNLKLENGQAAQAFINILDSTEISTKKIYFNEFYHMSNSTGVSMIDVLGESGTLILVQIILALIILLFIQSRRFGKPNVVFEIVKRKENENLFALSNIYIKSRAYKVVLNIYYKNLKRELSKFLGLSVTAELEEILSSVSNSQFLNNMGVIPLCRDAEGILSKVRIRKSEMIHLVSRMEKVRKEII